MYNDISGLIYTMDMKINSALDIQEQRVEDEAIYFMKREENELRDIIHQMNEKLAHDDEKDEMIKTLREQAEYMKELITGQDREIKDLREDQK